MAGSAQNGGDDDLITAINVTPLVDVVLVLLIILMVTASYIVSKSIPMDLPQGNSGEATPRTLTISIDRGRIVYLDAERIELDALRARVRTFAQAQGAEARAVIAADATVPHGDVVRIMDLLRRPCGATEQCRGVTKFAINIQPEARQGG